MKPDRFADTAPGRLVPISGARGVTHAFVPAHLPPNWKWPEHLWQLLLEARAQLAHLDGAGKHLPNPELVLRPLQNREAQKSSSLEGTYTDPQAQLLFALDPRDSESATDPVNAHREVFNYVRALQLRRQLGDLLLSLRLIRELHRTLMDGVRGSDRSPGEFRRVQNLIGRPPRYVPPPVPELPALLDNFERYLDGNDGLDPLVRAFVAHYQFEAIHPFIDGNGPVGRLLLAVCIAEWCGLAHQWLYMSDYFDRNRDQYIDGLFDVSTRGSWSEWIEFCLQGVLEQASDTAVRYERLIELHRRFHDQVHASGATVRLSRIVDELFLTPAIRVTTARDLLDISYPTARSDLKKLAELDILRQTSGGGPIAYTCPPIFEVIYGD